MIDAYDPWFDADSRTGLRVDYTDVDTADSTYIADRGLILINRRQGVAAQRCSLAHQLMHLDSDTSDETALEVEVAKRLVSTSALVDAIMGNRTATAVARSLNVTIPILMARLSDRPNTFARFEWPDLVMPHRCLRLRIDRVLSTPILGESILFVQERKNGPHAITA